MSDEDIINLLKASLLSEDAPPLTDAEVDAFMTVPVKHSPVVLRRMRRQFVAKVLEDMHREPVKQVVRDVPFGGWVEAQRRRARLSLRALAEALRQEQSLIGRIESEAILPWKLPVSVMRDIVVLFRIHIDAVAQLLSASFVADRERKLARSLGRDHGATPSNMRAALIEPGQGPRPAPDEPEPPSSEQPEMDEEVQRFLNKLRQALERSQASHLLN